MPPVAVLVLTFIAVVFGLFAVLFTVLGVRQRRRGQRRAENGVRSAAVVVAVEPMLPPERGRVEQPFSLLFGDHTGREHTIRFTSGFKGVVPVEGWHVTVLFDPDDPDNVEITENPHLRGVSGEREPSSSGARWWAVGALAATSAAALTWGLAQIGLALAGGPDAQQEQERYLVACGMIFLAAGLGVAAGGVGFLATAIRRRRDATVTTGTIAHTWTETRRTSGDNGPKRTTVYPYSVRFGLPDGRVVHRRAPHTPTSDRNRAGQEVRVAYQPGDPTVFTVGPARNALVAPVLTLVLGGAFSVLGVLLAVLA